MSETEFHTGKLMPTNSTLKEFIKKDIKDKYYPSYSDSNSEYEEFFRDKYYKEAVLINGFVFTVQRENIDEYDDIFKSTENKDGSIDFTVRYYNGGCSFDEAISESVKKMETV